MFSIGVELREWAGEGEGEWAGDSEEDTIALCVRRWGFIVSILRREGEHAGDVDVAEKGTCKGATEGAGADEKGGGDAVSSVLEPACDTCSGDVLLL